MAVGKSSYRYNRHHEVLEHDVSVQMNERVAADNDAELCDQRWTNQFDFDDNLLGFDQANEIKGDTYVGKDVKDFGIPFDIDYTTDLTDYGLDYQRLRLFWVDFEDKKREYFKLMYGRLFAIGVAIIYKSRNEPDKKKTTGRWNKKINQQTIFKLPMAVRHVIEFCNPFYEKLKCQKCARLTDW